MMDFEILRGDDGKPICVNTDDGFAQCNRSFNPEEDGWMEDQLDPRDFPAISIGRQVEALVYEVNQLRRENFQLKRNNKAWMRAAGFGDRGE